jgi:coenzyme F420-dependent glucose-6-phosphate dehydrogenase
VRVHLSAALARHERFRHAQSVRPCTLRCAPLRARPSSQPRDRSLGPRRLQGRGGVVARIRSVPKRGARYGRDMGHPRIGYHASHEQFAPSELLRFVRLAAEAGFDAAMCSDHLQPWSERQGQSGFAWSWLGSALEATELTFGTVNAPGQRYHPVIVAQAAATLVELYPDRFWLAVGSGEAMNEAVTGGPWPVKDQRNARLRECVEVMRALWAGETVTHRGLVTVEEARLWTLPARPPELFAAALSPETAAWAGSWADGLITVARPGDATRTVIDAFREGGGADKPLLLQTQVVLGEDRGEALAAAHDQWRTNIFESRVLAELRSPASFDAAAEQIAPDAVDGPVRVTADATELADWLCADLELGFQRVYVHHVGRDQEHFIERMASEVLPRVPTR